MLLLWDKAVESIKRQNEEKRKRTQRPYATSSKRGAIIIRSSNAGTHTKEEWIIMWAKRYKETQKERTREDKDEEYGQN